MGEDNNGKPISGDFKRMAENKLKYPEYVYFPNSTNLYLITMKSIRLIGQINGDYKKLNK